ncbi:MAG: peptidylprolyl isomerase [Deltaproteobacteria bacterium]|nr:peptidylprolyl isomerase [Deltaproteobacteria bacterium]
MFLQRPLCCLLMVLLVSACTKPQPSPTADLPELAGLEVDPARLPTPQPKPPQTVSISHILVSYKGAKEAYRKIKLTRAQANQRARHLVKIARAKDQDFTKLVEQFSDDTKTSNSAGDLYVIGRGELHPNLEEAAFKLGLGQISGPVESPKGFHILYRHSPTEAQAAEILITYDGAKKYEPRISRSYTQAKDLAAQIRQRIDSGEDFVQLAIKHSDLPNYDRGGIFPIFRKGTRKPKFEEIVWNLPVGGLSESVETLTGFHIVKRLKVQRIQVRSMRINYLSESAKGNKPVMHSREEAQGLAEKIHNRLLDPQADFAAEAAEFSEGAARQKGGLKQPFGLGQIPYPIELVAFELAPGDISDVFEHGTSFIILKRIR